MTVNRGADVPELPLGMLGKDNPILHYGQVIFFEDEFADRGHSKFYVRFRVMKDCFFILQRSYIRIDHVIVRILDTRIFHQFASNFLIREFSQREATYSQLKHAGFAFGSDWLLSDTQSDQIYSYLEEKGSWREQIML